MGLSVPHILLVLLAAVLLFGRGKISDLMGDVAGGIKAFKRGMAEDDTPPAKATDPKTIDHQAQGSPAAPSANPADAKARADS